MGIFLCMRCAAIHRKLGTHISKVKSLSMDSWSNEQVEVGEDPAKRVCFSLVALLTACPAPFRTCEKSATLLPTRTTTRKARNPRCP